MDRTSWIQTDSGKNGGQFLIDTDSRETPTCVNGESFTIYLGSFDFDEPLDLAPYEQIHLLIRESVIETSPLVYAETQEVAEITPLILLSAWNAKTAYNATFLVASTVLTFDLGDEPLLELWAVFSATNATTGAERVLGSGQITLLAGVGDEPPDVSDVMLKSVYDKNTDGVVDEAETVPWSGVSGKPGTYPPEAHDHDDRYYTEAETDALLGDKADQAALDAHEADTGNPHSVTAAQTGADPAGSAAAVQANLDTHEADQTNPHSVTAAQTGADPAGSAAAVQANLDTHEADQTNPHSVTAAQTGADPAGSAAAVQANLDTHEADTNIHYPDAPSDSVGYVRLNGGWGPESKGLGEAPSDGDAYGRKNGGWEQVPTKTEADADYDSKGSAAAVQTNLDTHEADQTNPHAVTALQAGADPTGSAAAVQTNLDTHEADQTNPHTVTKAQVGLGNADDTSDADKPISTATQTALDTKLENVVEDLSPQLGGDLQTLGKDVQLTDDAGAVEGVIGRNENGVFVAYAPDGTYDEKDGGILCSPGKVEVHGQAVNVPQLAGGSGAGSKQVYSDESGNLYPVDPPAPGWSESDVDLGDYDLGTGTGIGPWVAMTGLEITVPEDVTLGDRIDVFANIHAVNKTDNQSGTIDIGFSINGADPTSPINQTITGGFDNLIPLNISSTTVALTAGDTVSVKVRRQDGSNVLFGVDLIGSIGSDHELNVSVPSEGGGGAAGVSSFKGRTGNVVPAAADYAASLVTNDSSVSGTNVDNALEWLAANPGDRNIFKWNGTTSSTADGNPGSGTFRWNNVSPALVTYIYINDQTPYAGADMGSLFSTLKEGNLVYFERYNSGAFSHIFEVSGDAVDGGGYWKIPVVHIAGTQGLSDILYFFNFHSSLSVGTEAGDVVQLNGSAQLPAVDGSLLTNLPGGDASAVVRSQAQVGHGFTKGEVVYESTGGVWQGSNCSDPDTAEVIGMVSEVTDVDNFVITTHGYVSGLSGGVGLTAHTWYYLDSTSGNLTATEPTANGYVSKPLFWAISTSAGYFINYRGMVIGGTDPVSGQVLQRQISEYDPSASQSMTTTHADVDGSDISFTPVASDSVIKYEFSFHCRSLTAHYIYLHMKLLVDGVLETDSEHTWTQNSTPGENLYHYTYLIDSWGTSAKTIKLQAREFNSSTQSQLHVLYYWDGVAASSKFPRAVLDVTEIAT